MKMFFNKLLSMAIRILLLLPLNIYSNVVIERFSLGEVVYKFFRTTAIVKKSVGKKAKKWFTTDVQYSNENFTSYFFKNDMSVLLVE